MTLSDEERKAKKLAKRREYSARPEVRARAKEWRNLPERKSRELKKNRERMKEYNNRPEIVAKRKEYNESPERKAKMREHYAKPETKETMKKYRLSPQGKAKAKARYTSPEVRARKRERYARPEVKAKVREYYARPEVRAKIREYDASPERKARKRAYRARPEVKVKRTKTTLGKKDNVKMEVYLHYSKIHSNSDIPCCRCCGLNSHVEFLSLDHIAGKKQMDSEPELRKKGYSSKLKIHQLLPWIKRNNFPIGFQILCLNCNFAKGHSKDNKCPHERK